MRRKNTTANALNTGLAILDLGDGIEIPLPVDGDFGGAAGPPGAGVPAGGTTGQLIRKTSNGSTEWATPSKSMVDLPNVDNTSDLNKPVSVAMQQALEGKADLSADGVIPLAQIASDAMDQAYARIDKPDLTLVVRGAKADGSTDDSAAWASAILAVSAAGGGVVTAPRNRTYIVQGLPLRENVWIDLHGIKLRHPVNPTEPMFVAPATNRIINGGISGGEMIGYNKMQHCIDFSAVTTLEHFIVENSYIHDFDMGYNSSQNDRFPILRDTRFWFNRIGMYVNMNHPIVHFCDFRNNDVGLTGDPNDMFAIGCKFNFNRVGVQPDRTKPNFGIRNSRFVGCAFARNTEVGLDIDHGNIVVGNQFYGNDSGDDGLRIDQSLNTVTSNVFGYMTVQGGIGGAGIRFTGTVDLSLNTIGHNTFQLSSPTGVGITANVGVAQLKGLNLSNNTCQVSTDRKFIDLKMANLRHSKVKGNIAYVRFNTTHAAGSGIMEFGNLGSLGCDFSENSIVSERENNPAHAMKFVGIDGCTFSGNRFVGFAAPIAATHWSGARFRDNPGFKTATNNLASIPIGQTKVTVTHGLDHPMANSAQFISVNPTNDMGPATKFWVSNVTATTFDIMINTAPGSYAANFRWAIDRNG